MLSRIVTIAHRLAISNTLLFACLGALIVLAVTAPALPGNPGRCLPCPFPGAACAPTPGCFPLPAAPNAAVPFPAVPRKAAPPPSFSFVTPTIKRYLVALEKAQVSPLLSEASDRPIKRSSVVRGVVSSFQQFGNH